MLAPCDRSGSIVGRGKMGPDDQAQCRLFVSKSNGAVRPLKLACHSYGGRKFLLLMGTDPRWGSGECEKKQPMGQSVGDLSLPSHPSYVTLMCHAGGALGERKNSRFRAGSMLGVLDPHNVNIGVTGATWSAAPMHRLFFSHSPEWRLFCK